MKYLIHCDGGSRGNPGPAASAYLITNDHGEDVGQGTRFLGQKTNNEAEYYAVIDALSWVVSRFPVLADTIEVYLDSDLLVNQLSGRYRVKSAKLLPLILKVKSLERQIARPVTYTHVHRHQNRSADRLVNFTLDNIKSASG